MVLFELRGSVQHHLNILFAMGLALVLGAQGAVAKPRSLSIVETTKYYPISGKTAAEFAISMGKNGPYSRQHRSRAWATAQRDMSYQLVRQKTGKRCRIKAVRVKMKITYTMPKPRTLRQVSKREQRKWRKMYALLNKHERVHGLYYKQLAKKVHSSLSRLKPKSNCRALDRSAKQTVEQLYTADKARNNRFDARDTRTYRRMERLYRGS